MELFQDAEIPYLREVYTPKGESLLDIIFVHGLNVDDDPHFPWKTWTENEVFWPQAFLPDDIPDARILVFGYNSNIKHGVSEARLRDHADMLLYKLRHKRRIKRSERRTPIIFVGHSLGGILIKVALLITRDNNARYGNILEDTFGLVFFGCPHRGTRTHFFGDIIKRVAEFVSLGRADNDLLESFKADSSFVSDTNERFVEQHEKYEVVSFFETQPMFFSGIDSSIQSGIVVDRLSARLGLPGSREKFIGLNKDHVGIAQVSRRSDAYETIVDALVELAEEACENSTSNILPVSSNNNQQHDGKTEDKKAENNKPFRENGEDGKDKEVKNLIGKELSEDVMDEAEDRGDEQQGEEEPRNLLTDQEERAAIAQLRASGISNLSSQRDVDDALLSVIEMGYDRAVKYLVVRKRANVEYLDKTGRSPLLFATSRGLEQVIRVLLEHGADVNKFTLEYPTTALIVAAAGGYESVVQLLLDNKAEINDVNWYGDTALMRAVERGREKAALLLINRGADLDLKDMSGGTALMRAASEGHESVVRSLLNNKAKVNQISKMGETALMKAASKGQETIARLLIETGADLEARNSEGNTALGLAMKGHHDKVAQLLIIKGANLDAGPQPNAVSSITAFAREIASSKIFFGERWA